MLNMERDRGPTPAEVIAKDKVLQQVLGFDTQPAEFRLGVKMKIYNGEMRSRRLALGLTQKKLATKARLTQKSATQIINQVEGLYRFPNDDEAEKIAKALNCNREVLFPRWLEFYVLDKRKGTIYLEKPATPELLASIGPARESFAALPQPSEFAVSEDVALSDAEKNILKEEIREVLGILSPRQRKVVTLRFGLEDGIYRTLDRVGEVLGVNHERVRQIEATAFSKLRGSGNSLLLKVQSGKEEKIIDVVDPKQFSNQEFLNWLKEQVPEKGAYIDNDIARQKLNSKFRRFSIILDLGLEHKSLNKLAAKKLRSWVEV